MPAAIRPISTMMTNARSLIRPTIFLPTAANGMAPTVNQPINGQFRSRRLSQTWEPLL